MGDVAIRVDSIGKAYRIGVNEQRHETMFGAVAAFIKSPLSNFRNLRSLSRFDSLEAEDVVWALKDVSFEVKEGEVVGIIGHNGAGKSTLLKILSRITEPTVGAAYVHGRVGSLLEVGTGFHPDLTGRENVYLNGTILGMRKREIDSKFDQIVEFSGVEKFIDTPVKRYSSGMRVRLAFSVAAHLEPEILIVDEVLAVGDVEFQKKCLGKMEDVSKQGRTVLFVSHNMAAVSNLCGRAVRLSGGTIVDMGPTDRVLAAYLSRGGSAVKKSLSERVDRQGTGDVIVTGIRQRLGDGSESETLVTGNDCQIEVAYAAKRQTGKLGRLSISVTVSTMEGFHLSCLWDRLSGVNFNEAPSQGWLKCRISRLPLMPGRYDLTITMTHNGVLSDRLTGASEITVVEGDYFGTGQLPPANLGAILMEQSWSLQAG